MEAITDISQLDFSKQYTYADYLTWWFDERIELIKGYIYKMSAPIDNHQKISSNLHRDIAYFLKKQPFQVRAAPYDVRLQRSLNDADVYTVVQPDICIICDPNIIESKGCNGAPDMIIEILSPNNSKRDIKTKYELYEESGVREYWIVHPDEKLIDVFLLDTGKYKLDKIYVEDDIVPVHVVDGLTIDLTEIFT